MRQTLIVLLICYCGFSFGQDSCNCLANLDSTIAKVTRNYAGFHDKVKANNQSEYHQLIDSLTMAATKNNVDTACFKLLKRYTAFFHDGHLGISLLKNKPKNIMSPAVSVQPQADMDIPSVSFDRKDYAIIKIPSFSIDYNDTIHKLFNKYKTKLEHTKNWIVDIRGNDGGAQDVYEPLLPYIYTNPIIVAGARDWCSPDNVKAGREDYEYYKNQVDSTTRAGWLKNIQKREASIGKWKNSSGQDTIDFNQVKAYPAKIAILIDKDCASSAEIFLTKARQSTKVTLFGTPTNGTVDYGDVIYWDDLPYKPFNLRIATSRWDWIDTTGPIDPTGIVPDVDLSSVNTSWVEYVKKQFR